MTVKRKRKLLVFLVAALLAWFLVSAAAISWSGLADDAARADAAVVFGNTVLPDGRPSPRLQGRLDKALQLHREGLVSFIIVSGGLGVEGHDEAEVMKRYLVEHGVPEASIHADGAGTNTLETARNASRLLAGKGMTSAVVVSQFFHVPRARRALRKCGVPKVHGAHADYFEWRDVYATAREVLAYYAYLLKT